MTRHTCQLNDSNGFVCGPCDRKRERFTTEFIHDYTPKLRFLLNDLRLHPATRDLFMDNLLDAYVDARMEDGDDS